MKNNSTQQEVLLITGSGFASRQYVEKDTTDSSKYIPPNEKLKEACWNGMIKEILPEAFFVNDPLVKLYLWEVTEGNHTIILEMENFPTGIDHFFSIDPFRFMGAQQPN